MPKPRATAMIGILALSLCGADSPDSPRDVLTIKAARSVVAEWALVNRTAARGSPSGHYTEQMRREARRQLASDLKAMSNPDSPASRVMARLLALNPAADPRLLADGAAALARIEKQLEDS